MFYGRREDISRTDDIIDIFVLSEVHNKALVFPLLDKVGICRLCPVISCRNEEKIGEIHSLFLEKKHI